MTLTLPQFYRGFEHGVDKMRKLSSSFCAPLGVTTFGYVRIHHSGCVSWLTTNPDQDRYLVESGALNEDPLLNTPELLKAGNYLWFNDRTFPGCETFYRERSRRYHMDHGLVIIRHQKDFVETCCFSGLLSKSPLYNLFLNESALFTHFMDHFTQQLDQRLVKLLEQGLTLSDLKSSPQNPSKDLPQELRNSLAVSTGWKNLLLLSKREKECLLLFKKGFSYSKIGEKLSLSERTVEHYFESVKNKLGLDSRSDLYLAAEKLSDLKLI